MSGSSNTWYHGSSLKLSYLRKGSTITQDRHLAKVFSHKPSIVSCYDDGTIKHDEFLTDKAIEEYLK